MKAGKSIGVFAVIFGTSVFSMAAPIAQAENTIKIGVPLELSGRFVSFGSAGKRGVEMAIAAHGDTAAGKKIEILMRDVQSEPQTTISVFNELILEDKVNYIVGPTASATTASAIPAWQRGKPLWVAPGSSTTKVEEQVGAEPNFFHTFPYAYSYSESLAAMLKLNLPKGELPRSFTPMTVMAGRIDRMVSNTLSRRGSRSWRKRSYEVARRIWGPY